jgi:hypothetical protein
MKGRAVEMLRIVAAATLWMGVLAAATSAQDARSRNYGRSGGRTVPDMAVKEVTALGKYKIRVVVANLGNLRSGPCLVNAAIYVDGGQTERFNWVKQQEIGWVLAGNELTLDFDTAYPVYGHRVTAYVFHCAAADAMAANDRKTVNIPAQKEEPRREPPVVAQKPKISPDLAVTHLYFKKGEILGGVENVGDRRYRAAGSGYKDSFDRQVTLQRIKRVGAHSYTETVGSYDVPHLGVGGSWGFAFTRPKNDPEATEYRWVLVVSGGDPDSDNDSFTKIEKVEKKRKPTLFDD